MIPDPQAESSEEVATLQGEATAAVGGGSSPSTQEVLNLAAFKYLNTIDPSKPEDMNGFVLYLEKVRNVLIVETKPGSLIITVECSSLEILDELWNDYHTGYLNKMAQKFLVTKDLLNELCLIEVTLTVTILQEEYMDCRKYFLQPSGKSSTFFLQAFAHALFYFSSSSPKAGRALTLRGAGMLVVSLRGVNFGFWSHLGCSEQKATIFSRQVLV